MYFMFAAVSTSPWQTSQNTEYDHKIPNYHTICTKTHTLPPRRSAALLFGLVYDLIYSTYSLKLDIYGHITIVKYNLTISYCDMPY